VRTALDTNILSALWSSEPLAPQISSRLAEMYSEGGLVICGPVYIELFAHPSVSKSFIHEFLKETGIAVDFVLDEPVWNMAADAFAAYAQRRRRSAAGTPKRLPADFLVAAHASLHADRLMTLDATRYRQDFPKLRIV
jgi:predicted nucleic acid-binding protein